MQRQDRAGMIPTLQSQQDGEDRTYKPTIKTVSLVSQIQGEFSALACPLPAPETRTEIGYVFRGPNLSFLSTYHVI